MTIRVDEPHQDSGEPVVPKQFSYVEELITRLTRAEMERDRARGDARLLAFVWVSTVITFAAIVVIHMVTK